MRLSDSLKKSRFLLKIATFVSLAVWGSSCSTSSVVSNPPFQSLEEEKQSESQANQTMIRLIEKNLKFIQSKKTVLFLTQVGEKIFKGHETGGPFAFSVKIFKREKSPFWNFSLPPDQLYLDFELLSMIRHEHELAALLAIEGVLIKKQDRWKKINTLFDFSEANTFQLWNTEILEKEVVLSFEVHLKVLQEALLLMYRAGYDPRGMISYYQRKLSQKGSLYPPRELQEILIFLQREVRAFPPLKFPVIDTPEFYSFRERMVQG